MAKQLDKPYTRICTDQGYYHVAAYEFERLQAILCDETKKLPRFLECDGVFGEAMLIRSDMIEGLLEVSENVITECQLSEDGWHG